MSKDYTLFVDGSEVNDHYLTLAQAKAWHDDYTQDGYAPYIHKAILNNDSTIKEYIHIPMPSDKE